MSLIEGVGDEVTDFFIIVGVLLIGWFAWRSTNIADQPLIRTVLILQHRTRTRIAELRANNQSQSLSAGSSTRPPNMESSIEDSADSSGNDGNDEANCPVTTPSTGANDEPVAAAADETSSEAVSSPANGNSLDSASEETLVIRTMDSFDNEDAQLLHEAAKSSSEEVTNIEESGGTENSSGTTTIPAASATEDTSVPNDTTSDITIKLKFINDDQKVVVGSLKEMLGDFKRRHFQIELESQKLVRLVFNGQVLQPDSQTLERCGLYNNCVVHCLVHQPRPSSTQLTGTRTSNSLDNSSSIYFNPQSFQDIPTATGLTSVHNDWDLSRLLVSILTLTLGIAWYSRFHYAQLYTATTTLALYALTALFTISLLGHFFPDEDTIRNIE